ncbi:MAG TPA: thioredoxin family protein, partial [Anaeromyxobacteraceae bacterium]|nr:thioredoxin family protein [Anaeromyxobacteraceae bacterium]
PICRRMEPVVAEAERSCGHVHVEKAFVEEPRGAALVRRHGVRGVPTFLVLDGEGEEVSRLVGEQPLEALIGAMQRISPEICARPPALERLGS